MERQYSMSKLRFDVSYERREVYHSAGLRTQTAHGRVIAYTLSNQPMVDTVKEKRQLSMLRRSWLTQVAKYRVLPDGSKKHCTATAELP